MEVVDISPSLLKSVENLIEIEKNNKNIHLNICENTRSLCNGCKHIRVHRNKITGFFERICSQSHKSAENCWKSCTHFMGRSNKRC